MRIVLQRVARACVTIDGEAGGSMGPGLAALVGFRDGDGPREIEYLLRKTLELRIFNDRAGRLNRSLLDTGGSLMLVPNFTLYADCKKGRRPSFTGAAGPEGAAALFGRLVEEAGRTGVPLVSGRFGADMQVELCNDGPVTILLDSAQIVPQGH